MALQQEVWVKDIEDKLFEGAAFINQSTNHDSFIVNSIVHVPQAGSLASVEKNRSTFPATISERTDTELTYPVDDFSVDPIRVRYFEDLQVSYAKRNSVMGQHIDKLVEEVGTQTIFNWAPSGDNVKVILTTGATTSTGPSGAARKKITTADIAAAAQKLDLDLVPSTGRFALMSTTMYYELFTIEELTRKDFMGKVALPQGVIDVLFGFNIMIRPTVVTYDVVTAPTAPTKSAIGAAPDANDSFSCIFWQSSFVAKALGSTQVYLNQGVAENFGDIMSAELAMGSSALRNDARATGVVAVAQSA